MSKKKKILLGIVIVFFSLFLIYKYVGFKGYFKIYQIPTTSSSPTLELGDHIFVTNILPAKKNDLVVFKRFDKNLGLVNFVFRMIAEENDTLLIKDGITYVNGINIDKDIRIKHSYIISIDQLKSIEHLLSSNNDYYRLQENKVMIHLEDNIAKNLSPKATLTYSLNSKENRHNLHKTFSKDWDMHNFGPLIIPENKFFVMGDNRDNAMDSRIIGLIDESNYIGKAINVD